MHFRFFVFLALLLPAISLRAANLDLVGPDGQAAYVIVVADDAIPAEKTAANELKKFLDQITGASFPLQSPANTPAAARQIVVGPNERAKALLSGFDWQQIGTDGITLQTGPNWLVLAGDRPRGTLYAVYEFLETIGCVRFWYSDATTVPSRPKLSVPDLNVVYTPVFSYREHFNSITCGGRGGGGKVDEAYTARLRENGHFNHQKDEWGGHYTILGWCHTLPSLIPVGKYFKDHPEWFPDPKNGMLPCTEQSEMPKGVQPVLTAPGVAEETAKNALELIRKDPSAGYISISQDDGGDPFAKDPAAMAIVKKEGSQSAVMVGFVNKVADLIHQEYPDYMVETLAYTASEQPPKTVAPGDNVIIRLAVIAADFGHPLDSGERNKDVARHLQDWSAIAPRLFVWSYFVNFTHALAPHPNWAGIASDLRLFAVHHVKGVFEQGNNYTDGAGDFVELRSWLVGKLLWNPDQDQSALTDEFMNGYYGPVAGPLMRQYLDLYENAFLAEKGRKLDTYNEVFTFLDIDKMNQATKLFDQAAAAVKDDPVLSARLARVRISLDYTWLLLYKDLKRQAEAKGVEFLGPADLQEGVNQLEAEAKALGVGSTGETRGGDLHGTLERLRKQDRSLPWANAGAAY
jgi:hypothetical protein